MDKLITALEELPDNEPWHVCLGESEFILSDFELVDPSIYNRSDVILANVVKNISGSSAITSKNKIEFDLSQVRFVKSVDGARILYVKGGR